MQTLAEYWELIVSLGILLIGFTVYNFKLNDIEVRPIKDHIEDGWGESLDMQENSSRAEKRVVCLKLTFFCEVVFWLFVGFKSFIV